MSKNGGNSTSCGMEGGFLLLLLVSQGVVASPARDHLM